MMKYICGLIVTIFFFSGCSTPQPQSIVHPIKCKGSIYSLKSAECLSNESFISKLEHYPVIFFGDNHESDMVHNYLADTIIQLNKKGYKIHLANEWFTPKDNELLKKYSKKEFSDAEFTKKFGWKQRLNSDFRTFAPIYHAVQDSGGMLYGINMSKYKRRVISNVDFDRMSDNDIDFFTSLDVRVSPHRQMLSPFFSTCHTRKANESDRECIERMYMVQVAWDTKMGSESAKLAADVLKTPKDKLIVFVGAFHMAYGLGANLRFARESELPFVSVIPLIWNANSIENGGADFAYLYQIDKESSTPKKH